MGRGSTGTLLNAVRGLLDAEAGRGLSDAELLGRFRSGRDEAAFAALLLRHGPLVWGVCRRYLHTEHDAEDAFQAAFLILVRRAGSIRKGESVGSWLYGVAYRVAMKARKRIETRQQREREVLPRFQTGTVDLDCRELQAVLDEEVQRLPARYRAPFILCCLEGRSRAEAAQDLGCREGTIASRVARARGLLQGRLTRRGVTLAAALCAGAVAETGSAAVPRSLLKATTRLMLLGTPDRVPTGAAALADDVLGAVLFTPRRLALVLLMTLALTAAGARVWSGSAVAPDPDANDQPLAAQAAKLDAHGDPLPPGAIARLGTVRQRAPDASLAVTADGKEIVAVDSHLTLRRFDAATGELRSVRRLPGGASRTWLSPHGTFALGMDYARRGGYTLELWDLAHGKRVHAVSMDIDRPNDAAWTDDEKHIGLVVTTPNQDHRVYVWEVGTAAPRLLTSQVAGDGPRYLEPTVALSPDGRRLVACHPPRVIRCWDVATGTPLWADEKGGSRFLFFSPDGKLVVTGSTNAFGSATFRDAASGTVQAIPKLLAGEPTYPLGFSPHGRLIALVTGRNEVALCDWFLGRCEHRLACPAVVDGPPSSPVRAPTNFAFTPDGRGFVRHEGPLQHWDVISGKALFPATEAWGHSEEVARLLFSPDGRRLASSGKDRQVRSWDIATARPLHVFPKAMTDHLAFTPDGRHILAMPPGAKPALRIWGVDDGRATEVLIVGGHTDEVSAWNDRELRVTADGSRILMLTWKNGRHDDESVLTVWDRATAKCLRHERVPWAEDSVFTSDGRGVLAADTAAQVVRLLDTETAAVRLTFPFDNAKEPRQQYRGCDLTVSPDDRFMAARFKVLDADFRPLASAAIYVGDMRTGRQRLKIQAHEPAVFAFAPDNRLFAVAGPDAIRLWETASWEEVGSIPLTAGTGPVAALAPIRSLALSPDGHTIATGHADSTILLWNAVLRGGVREKRGDR